MRLNASHPAKTRYCNIQTNLHQGVWIIQSFYKERFIYSQHPTILGISQLTANLKSLKYKKTKYILALATIAIFWTSCDKDNDIVTPLTPPDIDCCPTFMDSTSNIIYFHAGVSQINPSGSYVIDDNEQGLWQTSVEPHAIKKRLLPGEVFYPDYSPVDSMLVYSYNAQIFIAKCVGDSVVESSISCVTDGGRNFFPTWSPDGRWIAYDNTDCKSLNDTLPANSCGVLVVNKDKTIRKLLARGRMPDWSPDNQYIIYQGANYEVYRLEIENPSQTFKISNFGDRISSPFWALHPRYSPDGSQIIVALQTPGKVNIWIMDSDGNNATRIISGKDPAWSPDGNKIVFLYAPIDMINEKNTIWMIDKNGQNLTQITRGLR